MQRWNFQVFHISPELIDIATTTAVNGDKSYVPPKQQCPGKTSFGDKVPPNISYDRFLVPQL